MEELKEVDDTIHKSMREIIRENRMKDGYKVTHMCSGKYTAEQIAEKIIESYL